MVNTLAKDFGDGNPMVRGLALRTMTSLHIPYLLEHILPKLKEGLLDVNPYVRKTAALGCSKLLPIARDQIATPPILERLHLLIEDADPQVSSNALNALQEMLHDQGGVQMTESRVLALLQRFGAYNPWSRSMVLNLMLKYSPSSQEEVLAVLNLLDPILRTSGPSVALAVSNLFLKYTARFPDLHRAVYPRLKDPLISLTVSSGPETAYVVLSHVLLLAKRQPDIFADLQRRFYLKQSDPTYLKAVKIELLLAISKNSNILQLQELITELAEYALDKSPKIAHLAVHALTRAIYRGTSPDTSKKSPVAVKIAEQVVSELLSLLEIHWTCACDAAMAGLTTVLRLYPEFSGEIIPKVIQSFKLNEGHPTTNAVSNSIAQEAYLWALGEHGADHLEAPYLLEAMADNWSSLVTRVKLQLLTSTLQLFFARPPEMRAALLNVLDMASSEIENPAVLDKALLITRMLACDVSLTQKIFQEKALPVASFSADLDPTSQDVIFDEFNTLSALYREPSTSFIQEYDNGSQLGENDLPEDDHAYDAPQYQYSDQYHNDNDPEEGATLYESEALKPSSSTVPPAPTTFQIDAPIAPERQIIKIGQLRPTASLQPKVFETMWKSLPVAVEETSTFAPRSSSPKDLEAALRDFKIFSVASGIKNGAMTLFNYAQTDDARATHILVNMRIELSNAKLSVTIKSEDANLATAFYPFLQRVLQEFE